MKSTQTKPRGVQARPPPASRPHKGSSGSGGSGWLSAGLMRILVLGAIVIGGVAVVMWLRDMGSAAGVNWLH